MKSNKKAIVLENTLSVIVAVIGLLLLIYSAYYLYNKLTTNIETESAKDVATLIEGKINSLPENQGANITLRGVNGEGWALTAFDKYNPYRADACFFEPCIYVCKISDPSAVPTGDSLKRDCETKGFFRKLDFDRIQLVIPFVAEVKSPGGGKAVLGYTQGYDKTIFLPNRLVEIQIEKKVESGERVLVITHYSQEYLANKDKLLSFGKGGEFGGSGGGGSFQ